MKRLTLAVWLAMGAALSPPHGLARADFEAGVRAYDQGDFATAVAAFRPLAETGGAAAAYNLGVIHSRGEAGEVDLEAAARWFRVAAEAGAPAAQNRIGTMYFRGRGVPQDTKMAAVWIRRAAEQGDHNAQTNLARMYLTGAGVPRDFAESERWSARANATGQGERQVRPGIVRAPFELGADRATAPVLAPAEPSAAATPPPAPPSPPAVTAPVLAVMSAPPPPPLPVGTAPAAAVVPAQPPPPALEETVDNGLPRPDTVSVAPPKIPDLAASGAAVVPVPPPPPPLDKSAGNGMPRPDPEAAAPAEVAALAAPEAAPEAGYLVQLISLRTATQAQAAWRQFGRAHAAVLDGLPHRVERADLGRRGVFYRLRVGPFADRATALKLCRDLTARRLNCWIAVP